MRCVPDSRIYFISFASYRKKNCKEKLRYDRNNKKLHCSKRDDLLPSNKFMCI